MKIISQEDLDLKSGKMINIRKNSSKKLALSNCLILLIELIILILLYQIKKSVDSKFIIYQQENEKGKEKNLSNFENNDKMFLNIRNNKDISQLSPLRESRETLNEQEINFQHMKLLWELNLKHLEEVNKKRTFEKRYPLPKEIKCNQHLKLFGLQDMLAFTSFLTKDTIFFEFGSGCSSVIAKYFAKKTYAIEGNKKWYEIGLKNGLKGSIFLKNLNPDGLGKYWSTPGNNTSIEDWKQYFQSYKKEYNADVIFIDGRFRVACAFDIFNKIRDDTIVLIHEFYRPPYYVIEDYYNYLYHWGSIFLYQKKSNIKEIPLEVQEKYWYSVE